MKQVCFAQTYVILLDSDTVALVEWVSLMGRPVVSEMEKYLAFRAKFKGTKEE